MQKLSTLRLVFHVSIKLTLLLCKCRPFQTNFKQILSQRYYSVNFYLRVFTLLGNKKTNSLSKIPSKTRIFVTLENQKQTICRKIT